MEEDIASVNTANYEMDQEKAQVLYKEGSILVFLDVPEGTVFGIDCNSWNTGPKFKGVKMIPPGIHFVYYSAVSGCYGGDTAPRTGFFHNFKSKEIVVKRWDPQTEDVQDEVITEDDLERFSLNRKELDRFLGPYPYENYKKWISLTNHITGPILEKLQPLCGKILSVIQLISEGGNTKERQARQLQKEKNLPLDVTAKDDSRLPQMKEKPGTCIRFSEIPKQKYPAGAAPSEVTKYSMDASYALKSLLSNEHSTNCIDILGEIQFAFVCFLIGQVYDAFEQWKRLVHLMCTSESAVSDYTDMYMHFVGMLHFQVKEVPEDFFVDIVSSNNFLTTTLQEFFANLETNENVDSKLKKKGLQFREHLTKRFKWDFTTEPDEYAPVIVE